MSSDKQLAANRRNAQKSTGPRTPEGKAAASMNAIKSGIHAKSLLIKGEKLAELELLIAEHYRDHSPSTAEARALVDDVIRCEWILRRLDRAEAQLWEHDRIEHRRDPKHPMGETAYYTSSPFTRLQWRVDSTRRALYRALKALRDLKSAPPAEPAAAPPTPEPETTSPESTRSEIGFVPQPAEPTPFARRQHHDPLPQDRSAHRVPLYS